MSTNPKTESNESRIKEQNLLFVADKNQPVGLNYEDLDQGVQLVGAQLGKARGVVALRSWHIVRHEIAVRWLVTRKIEQTMAVERLPMAREVQRSDSLGWC
ncbi:hypothetical protein NL676_034406 [Syzygium grande]|nr:hypothetical protein NL676_034406 [Syzygium grande]